jgi:tyrosinase
MMNAVLSPGDPVFFLHHTNLDRLWWEWQSANSTVRLTEIGGNNTPTAAFNAENGWNAPNANLTDYSGDPGNVTTLSHVLWMVGMISNVTISDVMDIRSATICAEYV